MSVKINILLVEDCEAFSELLIIMMKKHPATAQFSFELATSLKECFNTLESGNTDIALLDLGLTDTNGLQTIERFNQAYPDIPVIILTGHSTGTRRSWLNETTPIGSPLTPVNGNVEA